MSKIISIFLISTLVLTLLCGCEGDNNVSSDVSQIEAVINMSSEETSSEIENVSNVESIVSSEPEPSSEVSTPKYPDRTEVPYTVGVGSSHSYGRPTEDTTGEVFKNGELITNFERLQQIKDSEIFYDDKFFDTYNEEYFKDKALLIIAKVFPDSGHETIVNSITKKDGVLYADFTHKNLNILSALTIWYTVTSVEIKKCDIEDVTKLEVTYNVISER